MFSRHSRILGWTLLTIWAIYWAYSRPYSFGSPAMFLFLIGLQLLLAAIFHYRKIFFSVVMLSFLWAGTNVPFRSLWGTVRWAVLLCGAIVGLVLWLKEEREHFGAQHLIALFCGVAALTSAVVSAFPRTAFLKAMSLVLLFAYTSSGTRLAILNHEWQFPRTLVRISEGITYLTAGCYLALGLALFGNPNSLGAVVGVVLVPTMLWGVLVTDAEILRRRYMLAFAVSVGLLLFSRSRAGMLCSVVAAAFLLLSLKHYRLFLRGATVGIAALALVGLWSPHLIWESADSVRTDVIYKGHTNLGLLGSRKEPWDVTMETIQEHPFFGGGFGTTQTGAVDERDASAFVTTLGTSREHGNSYLALLEWVGLLGIVPFLLLIGGVLLEVKAVSGYMRRTLDATHPAVPLATICLAGLVHAMFEDWLFAVGYYLSVFFWCMAFCLMDVTRRAIQVPAPSNTPVSLGRASWGRFAQQMRIGKGH